MHWPHFLDHLVYKRTERQQPLFASNWDIITPKPLLVVQITSRTPLSNKTEIKHFEKYLLFFFFSFLHAQSACEPLSPVSPAENHKCLLNLTFLCIIKAAGRMSKVSVHFIFDIRPIISQTAEQLLVNSIWGLVLGWTSKIHSAISPIPPLILQGGRKVRNLA